MFIHLTICGDDSDFQQLDDNIFLHIFCLQEGAALRRTSESMQGHGNEGGPVNIAAAIDPTYNTPDSGNVVLMNHRRSLNEGPPQGKRSFIIGGWVEREYDGGPVNIAAAIDPTYSTPDSGNVILMNHRR